MSNLEITKPELIWPGKYDEHGSRVVNRGMALPFQVVETMREGRATREPGRMADLFSYSKPATEGEWNNKLIWGDNQLVMASLMEQFAGKIDLIYVDRGRIRRSLRRRPIGTLGAKDWILTWP